MTGVTPRGSTTLLVSVALLVGCAGPRIVSRGPLSAPDHPAPLHAPLSPCAGEASTPPAVAAAAAEVVRLPPVDAIDQRPDDADRVEALRAEVDNDGNTLVWFSLAPETEDAAATQQGLAGPAMIGPDAPTTPILPPLVDVEPLPARPTFFGGLVEDVLTDHCNFYSLGNLASLGAGLGVGAAMANTTVDEQLRHFYRENIPWSTSNPYWRALHTPKFFGDGYVIFPAVVGTALLGAAFEEGTLARAVGDWGGRSLRTYGVGGPMLLALQYATGGSRPDESPHGSSWAPFRDTNGVSGHAFIGAVPFLTAAKMVDSPLWKTAFYAGSVLPGLSRINDGQHYSSQVLLGWWLAYLSATAVDRTVATRANLSIIPLPVADGVGLGLELRR